MCVCGIHWKTQGLGLHLIKNVIFTNVLTLQHSLGNDNNRYIVTQLKIRWKYCGNIYDLCYLFMMAKRLSCTLQYGIIEKCVAKNFGWRNAMKITFLLFVFCFHNQQAISVILPGYQMMKALVSRQYSPALILRPEQKCLPMCFVNETFCISIQVWLNFVDNGPPNIMSALVQVLTWCQTHDRPLFEPMIPSSLTNVSVRMRQYATKQGIYLHCAIYQLELHSLYFIM